MWLVSWILTMLGVFSDDKKSINYLARTDAKNDVISGSAWMNFTYPFMFGFPKMSLSLALAFTISAISSMFESVGDYYATQKACQVERVPKHAVSRGILTEGIGVLLSGAVGVGYGTTSHSGNIGILILSKNASRVVLYTVGLMLMAISLFGKLGGVLTAIPNPVIGGVSTLMVGTLVAVGLSNLQNVDMSQTRNMLVVGLPLVVGLVVPSILDTNPQLIDTGVGELNRVLVVIVGSPMFLGGILSLILDNTVQGSKHSRGFKDLKGMKSSSTPKEYQHIYSWSIYPRISAMLPCIKYLPFLPPQPQSTDITTQDV